jgi:hypothetical protein
VFSVMFQSSSSFVLGRFRVVRAKLPPLAFSIHPSSILANCPDPESRTKDSDEEEVGDMALNSYADSRGGEVPRADPGPTDTGTDNLSEWRC